MRRDKFPSRILCTQLPLALALFLSVPLRPQAQIRHSGNSDSTQLTSCAEAVLHKRVLLHPNMPFKELAPLCKNQPRDEFLASLKAHSVGVKEDDGWAYLLPAGYFGPWSSYTMEGEKLHWKSIKVEVAISNADLKGGQTEEQLKPEVLQDLKEQVIKQARLVPVFEPHPRPDAETARVTLNLTAYVRHLRKGSPPSVVIVLREGDDSSVDGRIVYGDQQPDGGYRLIWDSPLVVVRYLQLWFFDVDGDGIEEILLRSAYPGGMHDLGSLSIFDNKGKELTRHLPCDVPPLYGFSPADGACPIVGGSVDLDYTHGPPYDIYVNNDGNDKVFTWRAGHFVDSSAPRQRPSQKRIRRP